MDITIQPGPLKGIVTAIPSKSQAHRLMICAAFADRDTFLQCKDTNRDIEATADCLRALGADIQRTNEGYCISPALSIPLRADLNCCESGSTLRFLLPVVGALGVDAVFYMEGRLPDRPLSPLWEEMKRMGCTLTRPTGNRIHCSGKLQAGEFHIDGGISSQFISGLLFACAMLPGKSQIHITGQLESQPYIDMTKNALSAFGVDICDFKIAGNKPFHSPGKAVVEGDWSNAAFFLGANTLGSRIEIRGLSEKSSQGDRAAADLLPKLETQNCTISAANIPDLVPILAVAAGANYGAVFTHIARLRLKESDRVESVAAMLRSLGGIVDITENTMTVHGTGFTGGIVNSFGDHRIAMAAAIAATAAKGPVSILGTECTGKSFPSFWDEFKNLGGQYEQYLR